MKYLHLEVKNPFIAESINLFFSVYENTCIFYIEEIHFFLRDIEKLKPSASEQAWILKLYNRGSKITVSEEVD